MSSFSGRYLCRVCKDPETLPLRPLVRCDSCKRGWHPACNPVIGDQRTAPFCCSKCLRKNPSATGGSSLPAASTGERGAANGNPDLSNPAPNKKPVVMIKVPPQPMLLQRKIAPSTDADSDSKTLKRKRADRSKRTYSDLWSLRAIKPRPAPEPEVPTWPESSLGVANDQLPQWFPPNGTRNRGWYPNAAPAEHQFPSPVPKQSTYDTNLHHPLRNYPSGPWENSWAANDIVPMHREVSVSDEKKISATMGVDREIHASLSQDIDIAEYPSQALDPREGGLLQTIEKQPEKPDDNTQRPALDSPVQPLVSRSTTPGNSSTKETPSDDEKGPVQYSLHAQRQQRAESFDPTDLDAFLQKQSITHEDDQCSPQELLETQLWGHIDPRVAWPIERSPGWLAAKREEIEARGGRKANFGKLLTAQVIKERKENGWGIHQNKDVVNDEKSDAALRALRELFGIKDTDSL